MSAWGGSSEWPTRRRSAVTNQIGGSDVKRIREVTGGISSARRWAGAAVGATMALLAALSVPEAALGAAPNPLPVPWIGQAYCQDDCRGGVSWQGRNNCGPASLAMVSRANGLPAGDGLTRARFVRHVKQLTEGVDDCGLTSRLDLDRGARELGLCLRSEHWSTARIEADTLSCLPVVTYLDERTLPWRYYPSNYAGGDHIVVATGFSGSRVTINDPLEYRAGWRECSPLPAQAENIIYGVAHTSYAREDFDAAAYLADFGWWGKSYGDPVGGCDVARCNPGAGAAGGPGGSAVGKPYDRLTFRLASHCPDNSVKVYYVTDHTGRDGVFHERHARTKAIVNDGLFRTYTITFDGEPGQAYWRGSVRKLRIDATTSPGCLTAFSWIGLHDADGRLAKAWTFPAGGPADGWWSRDTVTTRYIGPIWAMHSTSNDPWVENDRVNVPIGR